MQRSSRAEPAGTAAAARSTSASERARLVAACLRDCLRQDSMVLNFQPEVDLASGRFIGVEVLSRMPASPIGPVSPDEFVTVAERSSLIHQLGRWVLRTAIDQTRDWRADGPTSPLVSINSSPRELARPDFARAVLRALENTGFDPRRLCIEVTETAYVNAIDEVIETQRALRQQGIAFALDDFGTGHSSLDHLARFGVDLVKIDKSFVARIGVDRAAEVIVESIIAMAHALGKDVVAEGIETQEQLDALRDLECDFGQGYLFAKPSSATVTGELLMREREATTDAPHDVAGNGDRDRHRRTTILRSHAPRGGYLPAETTSFVGRDAELGRVSTLLTSTRLVTLTGPGGIGKTRLALRVGESLRTSFTGGTWFVELADLREPALLAHTVAERLGIRDQSGREPADIIASALGGSAILLLLDNCEHLLGPVAHLVQHLLRACPNLRILATSRQSIGLNDEALVPIGPLEVPDEASREGLEAPCDSDAVALFVDRARRAVPDFDGHSDARTHMRVREVVQKLEGIPLAIEMAAARTRSLSLDEILDRLTNRFALLSKGERNAGTRRSSLRAALDWSWDLSTDDERLLWSRLSVFAGDFTIASAESVCGSEPLEPAAVFELLDALADKSILISERPAAGTSAGVMRFRMLETLREYGAEKLADSGDLDTMRRRHLEHFALKVHRFARESLGPDQPQWIHELTRDTPNVRAALDFCCGSSADLATGMRMVVELQDLWRIRGQLAEALQWLEKLTTATEEASPEHADALRLAAESSLLVRDIPHAVELLEAAEREARAVGSEGVLNLVRYVRAMASTFRGDVRAAVPELLACLEVFRREHATRFEYSTLFYAGLAAGEFETERAFALIDECINLTMERGELHWRSWALWARGQTSLVNGDAVGAENSVREALQIQHTLGNQLGYMFAIGTLACASVQQHEDERAAVLFGALETICADIGTSPSLALPFAKVYDANHAELTRRLGKQLLDAYKASGAGLERDQAIALALA